MRNINVQRNELVASQVLGASVTGNAINIGGSNEVEHAGGGVNNSLQTGNASFNMAGTGVVSAQHQTGMNTAGVNAMSVAVQMNGIK